MTWRPAFIILILALTLINYWFGLKIWQSSRYKKLWLWLAGSINLGTLAFFKYFYFWEEHINILLAPIVGPLPKLPFTIILPLGISFFVFEFIHYVVDVYRGSKPITQFIPFALFAAFFPTQIAGPIKRFQDFIPQFTNPTKFSWDNFDEGISLILFGLGKKVLIADNLAFFVQGGYNHPELFHALDLWLFTYAFAFQIYFDFSGYTDIARGSALLFGYKVPINFNLPYLAGNISEFWHRWHISLSTWLRDYVFIPLGGSRCSQLAVARNLMITMTLGGLWHGASTHYLLWGVYHGVLLVIYRQLKSFEQEFTRGISLLASPTGKVVATLITFHAVCIGWVFFRADTVSGASNILSKMLFLQPTADLFATTLPQLTYPLIYPSIYLILPLLVITQLVSGSNKPQSFWQNSSPVIKAVCCAFLAILIMVFSPDKSPRFIYFQF
jgi:D-alanyl-lipoteichoic acid acyltransferase DltB (MBOAT superfamily)